MDDRLRRLMLMLRRSMHVRGQRPGRQTWETTMQPELNLRARSCPTCHSTGKPRFWAEEAGKWVDVPPQTNISDRRCTNLWHIEVRESEGRRLPRGTEALPEARAVPIEDLIEEISTADPEFRAAVERTERNERWR